MSEALLSQSSFGTNDSPKTLKFIKTHNLHATASNIEIWTNTYIYFYDFPSTNGGIFTFRNCVVSWQGASSSYEMQSDTGYFGISEEKNKNGSNFKN